MLDGIYHFLSSPNQYAVLLSVLMALVIAWDMKSYIIPNWIHGVIILAFATGCYFMNIHPVDPIVAALVVLGAGLLIYAVGFMGAGDIKLISALTLWTGLGSATVYLIAHTAIYGGILVIFLWLSRKLIRVFWKRNLPVLLTTGAPVPYGVAIAAAFLSMLWRGMIPALPV